MTSSFKNSFLHNQIAVSIKLLKRNLCGFRFNGRKGIHLESERRYKFPGNNLFLKKISKARVSRIQMTDAFRGPPTFTVLKFLITFNSKDKYSQQEVFPFSYLHQKKSKCNL